MSDPETLTGSSGMDLAQGKREPLTLLELIRYNSKEEKSKEERGGRRGEWWAHNISLFSLCAKGIQLG
jgi:hypothetical protein